MGQLVANTQGRVIVLSSPEKRAINFQRSGVPGRDGLNGKDGLNGAAQIPEILDGGNF